MAAPLAPEPQSLSPELVLIDPRLAMAARAHPPEPRDTVARLERDPAVSVAEARSAALQRILALSDSDVLYERGQAHRTPKVAAAIMSWSVALALVANERLYAWSTWQF